MHDYIDGILQAHDLAIKDHNDGYQIIEKHCAKTNAAPDNLFGVNAMRLQQLSTPSWQRYCASPRELGRISAWRLLS
jgi:hypothetical protein